MDKKQRSTLRGNKLRVRDQLPAIERLRKSQAITEKILVLDVFSKPVTVMLYASFRSEVDTKDLLLQCLAKGHRVCVPLTLTKGSRLVPYIIKNPPGDLQPGYYDIPEPNPSRTEPLNPAEIDVVLIPGSVFDIHGGRLGYGGGYYDRFLLNDAPQAKRIGLAFELQLVDNVPLEPHDQPLDILITEKRIVNISR